MSTGEESRGKETTQDGAGAPPPEIGGKEGETQRSKAASPAETAVPQGRTQAAPISANAPAPGFSGAGGKNEGKDRFVSRAVSPTGEQAEPESTPPKAATPAGEIVPPGAEEVRLPDGEEETWSRADDGGTEKSKRPARERTGRKERRKSAAGPGKWGKAVVALRLPFASALAGAIVLAGLAAIPAFRWGAAMGKKLAYQEAAMERMKIPPEVAIEIDEALVQLRNGDAAAALVALQRIDDDKGNYPSMSYLVALAAVQAGDVTLAEKKITETVVKRERVSDALALQAVLESMKPADPTRAVMGDPKVKAENYLRQAILADPANAAPRFELATLLRYTNRREEARKEIRAAQARLNPVDAHTVTEVTLALMDLEETPDDKLPLSAEPPRNLTETLVAANAAIRRGDFATAVTLLKAGREMTNPDIFYYLTSDPVFRRYRDRPELAEFLR